MLKQIHFKIYTGKRTDRRTDGWRDRQNLHTKYCVKLFTIYNKQHLVWWGLYNNFKWGKISKKQQHILHDQFQQIQRYN